MRNYGLGSLWGIPSGATPTPRRFATLKDVSMDIGGELDVLRGEKAYAIDAAKKGAKLAGKIGIAELDPNVLTMIVPGITKTTGTVRTIVEEVGTIPGTPFAVTVAQAATWVMDLGVIDSSTGLPMTRVASAPATGQYSVAAGVYTFAAADTTKAVRISYTYSVAGSGSTYAISNVAMQVSTPFIMLLGNGTNGKYFSAKVLATHIPKIGLGFKSEGWTEYNLEYEATADSAGNLGYLYTDDA